MKVSFSILLLFVFFKNLNAQTCCSGGIPLSNNIGLGIQEKGTAQLGVNYDYNYLNTLNDGKNKLDDHSRLRITHSILININYSITNNLAVEGLLSWVNQRRKISQFGNENLDQTSGLGDGLVLLKYKFSNVFGENSLLNIGVGTKIPIGSSTKKNKQGITLNADLQPGSNAWDIVYWSSFLKNFNFRPSFNISSSLIYRSTGTNASYFGDSSYSFGNEFQYYLDFSDSFLMFKTMISPSISIKYRNASQDKIGGFKVDNTGGNWIAVLPSFSIMISQNVNFLVKTEIPIYSKVDGTQLTPTYRLTSGLLIAIPSKTKKLNLNL